MREENYTLYYSIFISNEVKGKIYEIFYVGISAYNRLLQENPEMINSKFFKNIDARLLTFLVYRQYEDETLKEKFPLKININKVNNFGYNTLILEDRKYRLSIAKTLKKFSLPNKSKYRKFECRNNSKEDIQLKFNFDEVKVKLEDDKRYFIIGFSVKGGEIDHLDLLMPNSSMDYTIVNIDLLDEYYRWISGSKDEPEVEQQIVRMKEEALKFVSNER